MDQLLFVAWNARQGEDAGLHILCSEIANQLYRRAARLLAQGSRTLLSPAQRKEHMQPESPLTCNSIDALRALEAGLGKACREQLGENIDGPSAT